MELDLDYEIPYKDGIEFSALALQDEDFAKFLKRNGQLDFSNQNAVMQLTKSLLKRDFGLHLSLPQDRLCPPVPNRVSYIVWIQGLLDSSNDSCRGTNISSRHIIGLDVGTGASCIYPLLGSTMRSNWQFIATEVDEKSLEFARANIELNNLESRIRLVKTDLKDPLLPLDYLACARIDFTMCNPPFFESTEDMLSSAKAKKKPPFTACTGSKSEMVTAGGEVAFVMRMIDESLMLKSRVRWFTSMLGKRSSLAVIQSKLGEVGIENFAITEFIQGSKTKRWAIAWSFDDWRPSFSVARGLQKVQKSSLPFPPEFYFLSTNDKFTVGERVNEILSKLCLDWQWDTQILAGIGFSDKDVWSRAARRQNKSSVIIISNRDEKAFGFKIQVQEASKEELCARMTIRWLKGHDKILFESFCGMMKRECSK
ncbi:BgTH12-00320 [Blumeria graminis f. sp. triticale]|uniref:BgTH12-00320 n=1 Tax=Blumeria graminis f. sp. triticale TaxID=1689686 RepID=A0A9W4GGQ5_BLUGR|nr:BgTH12-00320 [Blumeria graminis f. sp. triticale]